MTETSICATGLNALYKAGLKAVVDKSFDISFTDPCDLNIDLSWLLNRYAWQGTCKFHYRRANESLPTLYVDGKDMGPLDNLKVQELKTLAEPSSQDYENVEKVLEIKGNRINIDFGSWDPWEIGAMAPQGCEIAGQLCKLIIYDCDGIFKKNSCTVHGRNYLGTLVVCLPVPCNSGAFTLSDDRNVLRFPFDKLFKDNKIPWVSFYPNVRHEVQIEKSGMGMMLQYDIKVVPRSESRYITDTGRGFLRRMVAGYIPETAYEFQGLPQNTMDTIQKKLNAIFSAKLSSSKESQSDLKEDSSIQNLDGIAILLRRKYGVVSLSSETLIGFDRDLSNALKDTFTLEVKHVILEQCSDHQGGYENQPIEVVALSQVTEIQDFEDEEKEEAKVDENQKHVPKTCFDAKKEELERFIHPSNSREEKKEQEHTGKVKKVYLVSGSPLELISKIAQEDFLEEDEGDDGKVRPFRHSYMHAALFVYPK